MSVPAQPQSLLGTTLDELVAMFAEWEQTLNRTRAWLGTKALPKFVLDPQP